MYIIRETTERESDGLELSSQDTIISAPENCVDDIFHMYAIDARRYYHNEVNQLGFYNVNVNKTYCVYLIEYDGSEEGETIDFVSYGPNDFAEELRDEIVRKIDDIRRVIDDERLS